MPGISVILARSWIVSWPTLARRPLMMNDASALPRDQYGEPPEGKEAGKGDPAGGLKVGQKV
jgi:hypothetical protein